MYFFSHYYVERDHPHPDFVLGLILPDLLRHLTRLYNRHFIHLNPETSGEFGPLLSGIRAHFHGDHQFHAQPGFERLTLEITQRMVAWGVNRNQYRVSFLAHLWTEMLLDRVLLLDHPELGKTFYRLLEQADVDRTCRFLSIYGGEEHAERLKTRFPGFVKARHLLRFSESAVVAESLNRTYIFVCKAPLEDSVLRIIEEHTDELTSNVRLFQDQLLPQKDQSL